MNTRHGIDSSVIVLVALVAITSILVLFPTAVIIYGSFRTSLISGEFSIKNYAYLLSPDSIPMFANTLRFVLLSMVFSLVLGITIAWFCSRTDMPFARHVENLIILPFFIPILIGALGWGWLAAPDVGILNNIFQSLLHVKGPFDIYNELGMAWVESLYIVPYIFITCSEAFKIMNPELEEASQIAGEGPIGTLYHVTLSLIMPDMLAVTVLAGMMALSDFSVPAILGAPMRYVVFTTKVYDYIANYPSRFNEAAALSSLMFVICAVSIVMSKKLIRRRSFTTISGKSVRPSLIKLRKWRYVALFVSATYLLVSVVLPLLTVILMSILPYMTTTLSAMQFTVKNYAYIFYSYAPMQRAVINTTVYNVVSATAIVIMTTLTAFIVQRMRVRGKEFLRFIVLLPFAMPGVVTAIGLLYGWISFPYLPIYGTALILIIAYIARLLPVGLEIISSGLLHIGEDLEESARICGASVFGVLREITLPLLKGVVLGAWILIFVTLFREISTSIFLASPMNEVMPSVIYNMWSSGDMNNAAAVCVVFLVMVVIVLLIAQRFKLVRVPTSAAG